MPITSGLKLDFNTNCQIPQACCLNALLNQFRQILYLHSLPVITFRSFYNNLQLQQFTIKKSILSILIKTTNNN